MVDCPICNSDYLEDINEMISKNAEIKYIQSWCKDRNFKLTQKEIKEQGNLHLNNLEYSLSKLSSTNSIYLTLTDIEALLSLGYEELLPYFDHRQLKVDRVKKYDVIDIMLYLIDSLNKEVARLKAKLESMTSSNDLEHRFSNQKLSRACFRSK